MARTAGFVSTSRPAGVHEQHAFDHAGQDRVRVRALAGHLGQPRAELARGLVEHVGDRADLVAAVIARRPAEVAGRDMRRARLGHGADAPIEQDRRAQVRTRATRQARGQADQRQPADAGDRARRSTVSGSATRTNATGLSRTGDGDIQRVDASSCGCGARHALAASRAAATTSSRARGSRARRPMRASTSESPSTRPSAAMKRHARAEQPAERVGFRVRIGQRAAMGQQRGRRAAPGSAGRVRCPRAGSRAATRSTSSVDTPSASDVARKTATNVRVRKVTDVRAAGRRVCSRTA